jgi:two-component system cell cycle response regulator DivK
MRALTNSIAGDIMAERVLIVEDNEFNRILLSDILTYHGYEVSVAIDGREGLRMARELMPDLVLMDLQLPGIDGLTAGQRLKADVVTSGIRLIAVTSFAMKEDRERCAVAGFDAYVAKPFDTRTLPDIIRGVLGERSQ